jgi:hypothetical protein
MLPPEDAPPTLPRAPAETPESPEPPRRGLLARLLGR